MKYEDINKENLDLFLKGPWIKAIKIWWWIGCFVAFFYSAWGFLFFIILGLTIKGYELKINEYAMVIRLSGITEVD